MKEFGYLLLMTGLSQVVRILTEFYISMWRLKILNWRNMQVSKLYCERYKKNCSVLYFFGAPVERVPPPSSTPPAKRIFEDPSPLVLVLALVYFPPHNGQGD